MQNLNMLDSKRIRVAFNRAATTYYEHAILQREIAERLLERLSFIRIEPQLIVNCGARTGYLAAQLARRYPSAHIIATEYAQTMLEYGLQQYALAGGLYSPVCADSAALPLPWHSVDLIIAHLVLHWTPNYGHCLANWLQLLKPNGLLLFTTMGPDTLGELYASFAAISDYPHVHIFPDMHDLGDLLLAQNWVDVVVDSELLTINYKTVSELLWDLKATGVTNANQRRCKGLMGKQRWQQMLDYYQQFATSEQRFPAHYEVIYGHGWQRSALTSTQHRVASEASMQEITVPVSSLRTKSF